jgi:hypothetical protein
MKTYGGSGCVDLPFLTSELDGGEWSASHPGRLTPGTLWIRRWVGSRAGLDAVVPPCFERVANMICHTD